MSAIKTTECERSKEFSSYFQELDRLRISWGLSDLRQKARELGLPVLG